MHMATLYGSMIRRFLRHSSHTLKVQQRWAQAHDTRSLATHQEPRPVTEKYEAKLDNKAKEYAVNGVVLWAPSFFHWWLIMVLDME